MALLEILMMMVMMLVVAIEILLDHFALWISSYELLE
jgi:hypothetical protein